MKNWDIARRDLLKSLGVGAACLPLLRSSKVWAQEGGYKRFLLIASSEGYIQSAWHPPAGLLAGATFPSSTKPLEPFKSDLTFLTNMDQPNYPVGYNWAHECYGVVYWGGPSSPPGGSKYHEPNGETLDQVIAKALPQAPGSRLSLNLMAQVDNKPASGTTGATRCFWTGKGAPINPQGNPATLYSELFANRAPPTTGTGTPTGPDPAAVKLLATKRSILDYVGASLDKFKLRVGRDERGSIEGHLNAVRTLETELSGLGTPMGPGGGPGGKGYALPDPGAFDNAAIASQPALFPKIMMAQLDILLAALTSGVTRVGTLQLSNSAGNYFNFGLFVPGVPAKNTTNYKSEFVNFHDAAHNPVQNGIPIKQLIDKWFMERFAEFLTKAKAVTEPGGNFLSNNLVMWGNHMGEGGLHSAYQIPWVLAGQAGGALKSGLNADGGTPIRGGGGGKTTNNAMSDICRIMGVAKPHPHWTGTMGI